MVFIDRERIQQVFFYILWDMQHVVASPFLIQATSTYYCITMHCNYVVPRYKFFIHSKTLALTPLAQFSVYHMVEKVILARHTDTPTFKLL